MLKHIAREDPVAPNSGATGPAVRGRLRRWFVMGAALWWSSALITTVSLSGKLPPYYLDWTARAESEALPQRSQQDSVRLALRPDAPTAAARLCAFVYDGETLHAWNVKPTLTDSGTLRIEAQVQDFAATPGRYELLFVLGSRAALPLCSLGTAPILAHWMMQLPGTQWYGRPALRWLTARSGVQVLQQSLVVIPPA